jgi:hypothetical protein
VEFGGPEQFSRSTFPVLKKYSSPEPCEKLETGHNKPAAKISILSRMVIPPRLLFVSLLFPGKRQRKSSCGQIIRVHVSPPGMLSKVLNDYVCNLAHANVSPGTNDMHAIKYITHACQVPKAIRLFRCIRIIATIPQGFACIQGRESGCAAKQASRRNQRRHSH